MKLSPTARYGDGCSLFCASCSTEVCNVSCFNSMDLGLEARGGIEPPIKVLQTFALPLGHRAIKGF